MLQTEAMSTAQHFRAVMTVLANVNTFRKGIFMQSAVPRCEPPPPPKAAFHRHFSIVFVDASGWLNFASNLSTSGLAEVRGPAYLTGFDSLMCSARRWSPCSADAQPQRA